MSPELPSRRHLLRRGAGLVLGVSAPALLAAPAITATRLHSTVDVTEGPFFRDGQLRRGDLRVDPVDGSVQAGLPLRLSIGVLALDSASGETRALPGAAVDLWQCDAAGRYAGEASEGTAGRSFLRGWQATDAQGRTQFTTIVPGAYPGRTPHIHCTVRGFGAAGDALTTQFFLDEALLRTIYADAGLPYRVHLGNGPRRVMSQSEDPVFQGSDSCRPGRTAGESLLLKTVRESDRLLAQVDLLIDGQRRCRSDEPRFGAGPGLFGGPPPGRPPGAPPGMPPGAPPEQAWQPGGPFGGPGGPPPGGPPPGPRGVRP